MISTHVLDTARGRPAAGIAIRLERMEGAGTALIGRGVTDEDGRVRTLVPDGASIPRGVYRLTFETGAYLASTHGRAFYPEVTVAFEVADPAEHHHVPLLLSPFGYSTYRGS